VLNRSRVMAVTAALLFSASCGDDEADNAGASGSGTGGSSAGSAGDASGGTGGGGTGGGATGGQDAGDSGGQAGGDAASTTVAVSHIDTFLTDTGNVEQPAQLSDYNLQLLVRTAGKFTNYPATITGAGTYEFRDVPAGPYYVAYQRLGSPPLYVVTTATDIDLGGFSPGRPDVKLVQTGTTLIFDATGLSTWQQGDGLSLHSMGAGTGLHDIDFYASAGAPTVGATAVSGLSIDYASIASPPRLIEGSKGDRAWLYQLVLQSLGAPGSYRSLRKALQLPSFTQADGQTTTLSGSLADVTQTDLGVDFKISRFESAQATANPSATLIGTSVNLVAQPESSRGWLGIAPDLIQFDATTSTDLVTTFSYGNPFPSSYGLILEGLSRFRRTYSVGTASGFVSADVSVRVAPSASTTLEPIISPPQDFKIADADALADRSGVGLQPSVSWSAPALGTVTGYMLTILRVYDDGGTLGRTAAGFLMTTGTSAVVPPGILTTGNSYVFRLSAFFGMSQDADRQPLVSGLPEANAEVLSGLVTP